MEVALAAGVVGLIPNHTHQADVPASLRPLFASYRHVLSDPQLGSLVVVAAFGFGVLFSYISQSPSIIQGQFGLAAQLFRWSSPLTQLPWHYRPGSGSEPRPPTLK